MKRINQKLIFDMLLDKQCLNQAIEELAKPLDLFTSAISSYHRTLEQKGYHNATVSSEEFYTRLKNLPFQSRTNR